MKPRAYAAGLTLLAVGCTVQKKEDPSATDSAAAAGAAATAPSPAVVPAAPAAADSPKAATKTSPKKSISKKPGVDSMRDSATEPIFEVGADGKVQRIKK